MGVPAGAVVVDVIRRNGGLTGGQSRGEKSQGGNRAPGTERKTAGEKWHGLKVLRTVVLLGRSARLIGGFSAKAERAYNIRG